MKKRIDVDKNITIILWIALTGLIVCVALTFFHVFDIERIFEKQAREDFEGQTSTAVRQVEYEVDNSKILMESLAVNLVGKVNTTDIQVSIAEQEVYTPGYKCYYIAENSILIGSDSITHEENLYSKLDGISKYNYVNSYVCVNAKDYLPSSIGESRLLGVKKLYNDIGNPYYLLVTADISGVMVTGIFDYIDSLGCFVIVDSSGDVIAKSRSYSDYFQNGYNVFDDFETITQKSRKNFTELEKIKRTVGSDNQDDFKITCADGSEALVYCGNIGNTDEIKYISFFRPGLLEEKVADATVRSYFVCAFLILIMVALVIYIWFTLNRSNLIFTKLAYIDEITGGYNFNYFKRNALRIMQSRRELPYLVMRFDVLNFRYINESYGHERADKVLAAIISTYNNVFDSRKELCVRINSDQFVAFAVNDVSFEERYNKFIKGVSDKAADSGVKYPIRFKIGYYQVRKDDINIDLMIDHANAARKSVDISQNVLSATYSENIISDMRKVDAIESEMQVSLAKGEFKVYIQPKWDIVKDKIIGGEALVRWIKNDGTVVFPSDFIPIFESNGFIEKLDFFMLEQLCIKIKELKKDNIYRMPTISVNQSRVLINNPDYVVNVEKILKRYDTDVSQIQLEITETVFFDQREKIIDVVKELKKLGLELAMDDFGSGYSSLNILKDVPFDILKIDKDFFDESTTSDASLIILQKIFEMSNALKLDVICEGVETKDQVEMLKGFGCHAVQGYYYGKPMPMEEFLEKFCKVKKTGKK